MHNASQHIITHIWQVIYKIKLYMYYVILWCSGSFYGVLGCW